MTRAEERHARAVVRTKLAEARKLLAQLAKTKRAALKQIKADCRAARIAVRQRVKAWRKLQAEIMKSADYGARACARDECEALKRRAIKEATNAADGVRKAMAIEAEHLKQLKKAAKPVNPKRRLGGVLGDQRRQEALKEIADNMPPEYGEVFSTLLHTPGMQRAIKRGTKPGSRLSATEAVLEYIQENPELAWEVQRKHEADAAREFDQHYGTLRKLAKRKRVDLSEVPF